LTLQPPLQSRIGPVGVLIVSGILGFAVGAIKFPTWQVAVESAQVVAGLVHYPPGNPFYIYHVKLWTILHQICAVLLLSGVSEISLSIALSGVLGMVSFQALAMIVYALSADVPLSIAAPFVIFVSKVAEHGVIYFVSLMGTDHTYGSLGLSIIVLVAGLIGSGCSRLGWALLGLAPAVHPSLGAWLWLAAGVTLMWDSRARHEWLTRTWKWFAAGAAVTALSLLIQLTVTYDVPHVDPAVSARYVRAFIGFWDAHRGGVKPKSLGVLMNAGALVLSSLWLIGFAERLPARALFLLRLIVVTAALALSFAFVSWIPADRVPLLLVMLIPARLLNFNVMIYVALLLGLLGTHRKRLWSQMLTLVLAGGLLLGGESRAVLVVEVVSAGLVVFGALTKLREWFGARARPSDADAGALSARPTAEAVAARFARVVSSAVLIWAVALTWASPSPESLFLDRTNDPLFAAAAADTKGLIVTSGSFHLVQLYTRRPVLIDGGGLDSLPYAPESGPAMDQILRDVYDIDLFHPPIEAKGAGVIPHIVNQRAWEKFSRERWLAIGRKYNVTQVLARSDYILDLPVAAENPSLRLYRIPE
jgi:hypothetical protein